MLDSSASRPRPKELNGGAGLRNAAPFLVHHRAPQRTLGVVRRALGSDVPHESDTGKVPPVMSSRLDSLVQEYQDVRQSEHRR